ncbi:hypothetical protein [Streptomyces sp. NPDC018031]|uniref:hypothetical protein n=1 Tax=Streptomyces sp. NPDC018031 TaxID=3365033 RepID=UPI0037A2DCA5
MAGGRRRRCGRRAVLPPLLGCLLAGALSGCGAPPDAAAPYRTDIQRMLDRRAEAVRDRDRDAFLATVDRGADRYLSGQRRVFANLADVPLRSWSYRFTGTGGFRPAAGTGHRIAARVELRYRIAGYDTVPVTSEEHLTLVRRDGRWYIAAGGGGRAPQQLWEQGDVTVVRGRRAVVLGVGQDRTRLTELARIADRAVPAVAGVWRDGWTRRVVVQVPASRERMAALLGAPADGYRGIAAVTTGVVGDGGGGPGSDGERATSADRVIVNPDAFPVLGKLGRQVVMTHETTHVATRTSTTRTTPLWLSEGFADWVAYRDTGRGPRDIAPELTRAVAAGNPPAELPRTEDFRFGRDATELARAYEESWLACRMIADRWGERKLVEFYRAVGGSRVTGQRGAVAAALLTVLDVSEAEFLADWREYAAGTLGRAD